MSRAAAGARYDAARKEMFASWVELEAHDRLINRRCLNGPIDFDQCRHGEFSPGPIDAGQSIDWHVTAAMAAIRGY